MNKNAEIIPFGEDAFLIEWSDEISQFNHSQVTAVNNVIRDQYNEFIIETTPSYRSLAIYLKKNVDTPLFIQNINKLLSESSTSADINVRKIQIPVCYDEEFGHDLEELSEFHNISVKSIIAHHKKRSYPVYFIGFLPGFPYLEGLNPMISTPRKEKPRSIVKAGSVGIAGDQTGIYPLDSPGGWNIIGRSPLSFFDIKKERPAILKAGDQIKFFEISRKEYDQVKKEVEKGTYHVKIDTQND